MKRSIFFITGTDTNVGKTVFICLLARHLRAMGYSAAALKPLCSGNRADARAHHAVLGGALTLKEINPWHFRAPLTPLLAARRETRIVTLTQVVAHVRGIQRRFPIVLIEGAGGLLSPLGENFDSRDLIEALNATPIVVCPNHLGAINQVRLVHEAFPKRFAVRTQIILMTPKHPDISSKSNAGLLGELLRSDRIHVFPRVKPNGAINQRVRQTLKSLSTKMKSS